MSVIAPIAATNLSAANAFYRAESYNVGIAGTRAALSTMQSIPVTFANAGNLKKVHTMLSINLSLNSDDPANGKSVNCSLRQINATNPTITIASPAVVTLNAHGFSAGQEVVFTTTGALPTGLSVNTTYYVIAAGLTANTFEVSATSGGSAINTSGTQSGTHTLRSTVGTTQTKTTGQLTDGIPAYTQTNQCTPTEDNWLVSFEGTYGAVTTAANTWTIDFWGSGAQAVSWSIATSDNTHPSYAAFCDNAVTATSASDFISFDYPVTVDESFTLAGYTGTGNATVYCGWLVKGGTTGDPYTTCNLRWQIPALAAYTLTLAGYMIAGAHAGIYVGLPIAWTGTLAAGATSATLTSNWTGVSGSYPVIFNNASPVGKTEFQFATFTNGSPSVTWSNGLVGASTPVANIGVSNANMGTIAVNTGFGITGAPASNSNGKSNFYFFGEVPAVESAILAANASAGQKVIVTTTSTGWPVGATLYVGGCNDGAIGDPSTYTISSISGATITLNNNLTASKNRLAPGVVGRLDGYGFAITGPSTYAVIGSSASNIQATGCQFTNAYFTLFGGLSVGGFTANVGSGDNPTVRGGYYFNHCSAFKTNSLGLLNATTGWVNPAGLYFNKVNVFQGSLCPQILSTQTIFAGFVGFIINNCIQQGYNSGAYSSAIASHPNMPFLVDGLTIESNLSKAEALRVQTASASIKNINLRWGVATPGNAASIGMTLLNTANLSNTSNINIDGFGKGLVPGGLCSGVNLAGFTFGATTANTQDIGTDITVGFSISASGYFDVELDSPTGLLNVYQNFFPSMLSGSSIRIYNPIRICTITIASPGVVTLNGHGYVANQPVTFATTGALPTGLVAGTTYYVTSPTTNTFQVSATAGGSAINTSGSQSGTQTVTSAFDDTSYTANGVVYRDNANFRSGPSAIRINTLYATVNTYTFSFPATSGVTYTIPLNMQYDTNYNSGLTIQPKVVATQGNNVLATVTSTSAALNAWERQTLSVSQSTGLTQTITLTFSCQSSTSTGNAWIDGLVALPLVTSTRFYGYLENSTSLTKTADPVTVLSETAALALSGLAYNFTTATLTISGAVTLSNIYDYLKAQLAAAANQTQANVITSADGVTFTGTFNVTMTASANVTGTGTLNIGSNTLTVAGGAVWGASTVIKSTAQALSNIALAGVVNGSTYAVLKQSDNSVIISGTASGTSVSANYLYAADVPVLIRLRKNAGSPNNYLPYEAQATILVTGLNFTVSQQPDSISA